MKGTISVKGFGHTTPPFGWLNLVNMQNLINRVYYITNEGAGYFFENEKFYFKKNYLYLLPYNANLSYYIDNSSFNHAFIDYVDISFPFFPKPFEIDISAYPVLKYDILSLLSYLDAKKIKLLEYAVNSAEFYRHRERINLFLQSVLADITPIIPVTTPTDHSLINAINHIHKNYINKLSVSDLASIAHLSVSQFSRLFIKSTGLTPHQYIIKYRFDVSLSMLQSGMPVTETAEKCGFPSASAFSFSFKKFFGFSPAEFKKRNCS